MANSAHCGPTRGESPDHTPGLRVPACRHPELRIDRQGSGEHFAGTLRTVSVALRFTKCDGAAGRRTVRMNDAPSESFHPRCAISHTRRESPSLLLVANSGLWQTVST